jgi:hypothetical protein
MTEVSHTTPLHTVVGIFPDDRKAVAAMHALDLAGFEAGRVQMVADDPSQAAEVGRNTYAAQGFLIGAIIGIVLVVVLRIWGNLGNDPVGLVIGSIGAVGGFAVIGLVVGSTIGRHAPDAAAFARAIRRGGAIVSVQCPGEERNRAMQVLNGAGAQTIRDEDEPGAF